MGVAALGAAGALAWFAFEAEQAGDAERGRPPPLVEVAEVEAREIAVIVDSTGTLEPPEQVMLTAESAGRVEEILFSEGDRVVAGGTLLQLEARQQRAAVERATAQLTQARRELARLERLRGESFVSTSDLDAARTSAAEAQAALDIAEDRLEDRRLVAPFAGVVGRRLVSPGALVQVGDPVASLTRTDPLDLLFDIPAEYLAQVENDMDVIGTTRAYPERRFQGRVTFVDSTIDAQTRTLSLEATVDNAEGRLKPGQFMRVELVLGRHRAITVPEAAILTRGPVTYVYAVDGEGLAQRQVVETGQRRDGWVEVTRGLEPEDRVVSAGVQSVQSGKPVRVRDAAPERDRGTAS